MRKLANRCLALMLALSLLLTSMPLTALANEYTGEFEWGSGSEGSGQQGGGDKSAARIAVENALANTDAPLMSVYSVGVQDSEVPTGATFSYSIGYSLNAAPTYLDGSNSPQAAYAMYEGITFTIKVPKGIVLSDERYTLDATNSDSNYDVYTYNLGNGSPGSSATMTVSAYIAGNGTVADGTPFDDIEVSMSAKVTLADGGGDMQLSCNASDDVNDSDVTNTATGEWGIKKSLANANAIVDNGDGTVTITWTINVGKLVDGGLSGEASNYNTTGVLNFADGGFTLTDTLPTITGKDGKAYAPISSTLSAQGMEPVTCGEGQTALTTNYHAEIDLTAGNVNTKTPYYTTYTVTATYSKDAFVLPFGDTADVQFTNDAKLEYQLVGEEEKLVTASADGAEGYPTPGGTIEVIEKLRIGSNNANTVEYNTFYASLFPNGATFEVYSADDWDSEKGAPKKEGASQEVASPVATLTVSNEDGATTGSLEAGTYYVVQTSKPTGTGDPEISSFQEVTVTSGGSATVTFVNPVPLYGTFELDKVNASGTGMSGVTFTLTNTDDNSKTYTLTTGDNGHGVCVLPAGTYTLTETTPTGYVPIAAKEVTIAEGATNSTYTGANAIVNYSNTGTLTINKQLAEYAGQTTGAVAVARKVSDATFTFKIYRSTSADFNPSDGTDGTDSTYVQDATIVKGSSSVVVSNLDVADANGNPYYYKVVEVEGDDTRFTYDTDAKPFSFIGTTEGAYVSTASVTATNVLKGKLKFQKNVLTLNSTTATGMDGATFKVYNSTTFSEDTLVATVTTKNGGVAITDPLPISDANGKINYYIVETNANGYTVDYPAPDNSEQYWGPVKLEFAETTDETSTAILNRENQASLTVKKQDSGSNPIPIQGATFTVQNDEGKYAVIGENGAISWQDAQNAQNATPPTLTTNASGQIVLSGIPNGTYTVTEVSVPYAYLSTGAVTGADEGTASTEGALSGKVTMTALESKTITFSNNSKPVLQLTKSTGTTNVTGNFTFELYAANEAGDAPTGSAIGTSITVTAGTAASITVPSAGKYFLKETGWPAGVIAPSLTAGEGVYKDADGYVYHGPYELANNQTRTETIANTPNTGSLTIDKVDHSDNTKKLSGATFTVSVDTTGWSDDLIKLLPSGFAQVQGEGGATATYAMTTGATGTNGQVAVSGLPLYNGTTQIVYTVVEKDAPTDYIKSEESQTATPANETDYAASLTFTNVHKGTITVTKNYYKQWEAETDNKRDYPLENVELGLFVLNDKGVLTLVGSTAKTDENGQVTFTDLDTTKTYYVFEISTPDNALYKPENGKAVAESTSNVAGETLKYVSGQHYYYKEVDFDANNLGTATLTNVEQYVQVSLFKYYYNEVEKTDADGNVVTDADGNIIWVDENNTKLALDRAKFYLYSCNEDDLSDVQSALSGIADNTSVKDVMTTLGNTEGVTKHDYVYESGTGSKPGMVVTEGLPATDSAGKKMYYWLVEFESPSGYEAPVAPCWSEIVSIDNNGSGGELENHPLHGDGTIRYVQIALDKVAMSRNEDGSWDQGSKKELADTTFTLYLLDGTTWVKLTYFTTGVDNTSSTDDDGNSIYDPGRGVSESFEMSALLEKYGSDAITTIGEGKNIEYKAKFKLVETSWPGNTTPVRYEYEFELTTNGTYDTDSTDATLWAQYTEEKDGPIINELSEKVTVYFDKLGYNAAAPGTTWPLQGAGFTIYSDREMKKVAAEQQFTDASGRVYFTLDPNTQYWWKETTVPSGYDKVGTTEGSFTTKSYTSQSGQSSSEGTGTGTGTEGTGANDSDRIATVRNVQYRKVTLTKTDSEGKPVAATFELHKNDAVATVYKYEDGTFTSIGTSVTTDATTGSVEFYIPAGTYTVVETKVGKDDLSLLEQSYLQSYFAMLNGNKTTLTIGETTTDVVLNVSNPGKGKLTIIKEDDAQTRMNGVSFTLEFNAFTDSEELKPEVTSAPATGWTAFTTGATEGKFTTSGEGENAGQIVLDNLMPGWYRITEQSDTANADYVLGQPTVVKVTASNFGGSAEAFATITNTRKGYLKITKAYEGVTDASALTALTATFAIYSDANCTDNAKVSDITITGASSSDAIALAPDTYYVKEISDTGDWYAYSGTGENEIWLGADNSASVEVEVTSGNVATAPVEVTFTNVSSRATVELEKVGREGTTNTPLEDAQFALYYTTDGGTTKHYWNGTGWGALASATKVTSALNAEGKATAKFDNVLLPYEHVSGPATGYAFYVTETYTPSEYAPSADRAVTLTPGATVSLTGDNAIVNEKGITITKYDKPYEHRANGKPLSGAQFTLYKYSGGTYTAVGNPLTTGADGVVTFTNLPQLGENEHYAIKETHTPNTHVEDSLELYKVVDNSSDVKLTGDNGYYNVTTNSSVTLNAYNTPKGKIAILKYDYINHSALPTGGSFNVYADGNTDLDKPNYYGTLRYAKAGDETILTGGYALSDNHYVKDGISYTVSFIDGVVPGEYTVTEAENPTYYLYTPNADQSDPWYRTKTVTVGNDRSTAVVVFANLPDPQTLNVGIKKAAAYDENGGSLMGDEYKTITFTISDFANTVALPLENATLTDDTFTFRDADGSEVTDVDWYVESVKIGAASYKETNYASSVSNDIIYATVNGSTTVRLIGEQTVAFSANDKVQDVEIVYNEASGSALDAGFTAGDVVITIKARQTGSATTKPVTEVSNKATISMTYDFGVMGANASSNTKTKTADANASVDVPNDEALPQVSIGKTSRMLDIDGVTPITNAVATPLQHIEYTVTLTGVSGNMQNPILADVLPAGLSFVRGTVETTDSALNVGSVQQAGQNVWIAAEGKLGVDETITLTILTQVQQSALINPQLVNNAYAFNTITVPQSSANKFGSSFADSQGALPSVDIPTALSSISAGGSGKAIMASVTNTAAYQSNVNISKLVSVDNSKWVSSEETLVAQKGGNIYYRVTVANMGDSAIKQLHILDVLPYAGDGNNSAWGPTLSGTVTISGATGTMYYSTAQPAEATGTFPALNAGQTIDTSVWSTSADGAKSFMAVIDELPAEGIVTLTYTTKVPENPDNDAYYNLAINNAHYMYASGSPSPLSSNITKVTIIPDPVKLGDRVWVDENANGIQDEGEAKVPGGTTTFTLYPYLENVQGATQTTDADAAGYYYFDNLTPAAPQQGNSASYGSDGDVAYTSLMGQARATYRLGVTIPEGYRFTTSSKTTVEGRSGTDSDFAPTSEGAQTGQTIRFYIPVTDAKEDLTYDVGVIRERELTITKKGTNGSNVAGAAFSIYGPYYTEPTTINNVPVVATITTGTDGTGTPSFTGANGYLNAYAYYVVVETSVGTNYSADDLTAIGTTSGTNVAKPTVTGTGIISKGNYFVLKPYAGANMTGAVEDAVTVTNKYIATGELTISGTKTLIGDTLSGGKFSFVLESTDDEDFAKAYPNGLTVTNGTQTTTGYVDVDKFAFAKITYDYDDVKALAALGENGAYHYTVSEYKPTGSTDGIIYDDTVYTITVTLRDNTDGKIAVNAVVSNNKNSTTSSSSNGTAEVAFTNSAIGALSVTKVVDSNVADDANKEFDFTLTLTNSDSSVDVNRTYSYIIKTDGTTNGTTGGTTDGTTGGTTGGTTNGNLTVANGEATFKLKGGQTIIISGIPAGTAYTVSETDYKSEGIVTTVSGTSGGTISTNGNAQVTFTNTHKVGGFTVSKTTLGSGKDETKEFNFTVTLEHATLPVNGTYGGQAFAKVATSSGFKAEATFTLKHGETKTFTGIPAGTTYTVVEQSYAVDGYVTKVGNTTTNTASGTVVSGGNPTVAFTNTREVGTLTVSKNTAGNADDENKQFDITVELTPPTGSTLTGSVGGNALSNIGTVNNGVWSYTFQLKHGESVEFINLPNGTEYKVSEADYIPDGYVKSVSGSETGTISSTTAAAVTYTNTRNTGSLEVTKTVAGNGGEADREFDFTLKLTAKQGGEGVDKTYDCTITGADGSSSSQKLTVTGGTATFKLKAGQTMTIDGIPEGSGYEVLETVPAADGYTATYTTSNSGTIDKDTPAAVSVTNTRKLGNLAVTKRLSGNSAVGSGVRTTFDITVQLEAPTGVNLTGEVDGTALPADGTVANGVWSKTFTFTANQTVNITNLPAGTKYTVSEADYTGEGFLPVAAQSDAIVVDDAKTDVPTQYVTVNNVRNRNNVRMGSLTIQKQVTGSGSDSNDEFAFQIELAIESTALTEPLSLNGQYKITYSGQAGQAGRLSVQNGIARIVLRGGQNAFIEGLPLNTRYTVTELATNGTTQAAAVQGQVNENGYELVTENSVTGKIESADGFYQASFTNDRKVGDLTVTKVVSGDDANSPNALSEFAITVTLTPPTGVSLTGAVDGAALPAGGTVTDGVWSNTFYLASGQSVLFTDLPEGTSYTVSEQDYAASGYSTTYDNAQGTVVARETQPEGVVATVTNTMYAGTLSIAKAVDGSGADTETEFDFALTLTNASVAVDNTYTTSMGTLTVSQGTAAFKLKGGETLVIYGIPEGTEYTVTEVDPGQYGYVLTATSGDTGSILSDSAAVASFTNSRNAGELAIEKTVTGALGEVDRAFAFTLELTSGANGIAVDGSYAATLYTADDAGQATTITVTDGLAEFTLMHGQRLVIHGIPAGATYEVSEASYALDGYQTSASGAAGTVPAAGIMPVASFVNSRDAGSLRIAKAFGGNAPIEGDAFTFTIRLSRVDGVDVNGTYEALRNGTATQITFTGGMATVSLTGGDVFEVLGILSGTTYAVSEEIPAGSGYTGTATNDTGSIPVDAQASASFVNTRNTGDLAVRKAVAGNAAQADRSFTFTVFLRLPDGQNANGTYRMTGRSSAITFVNGYASLSLAAGEEARIHGILSGSYYSVSENEANTDGYVTTATGAAGSIPVLGSALASFLNTRDVPEEPEELTTSRTVYKVWDDANDADNLRPDELEIYLMADGEQVATATLSEANGWSTVFTNLPVYNADGDAIAYSVVEAYTAEYYVNYQYAAAVINITNTHTPEDFEQRDPRDPELVTLIEDPMVPLGGNINMNEGDCFN